MSELLIVLAFIGAGVVLTFVIPLLSLARSTRAAHAAGQLQRDIEALRRQVGGLRRELAAIERALSSAGVVHREEGTPSAGADAALDDAAKVADSRGPAGTAVAEAISPSGASIDTPAAADRTASDAGLADEAPAAPPVPSPSTASSPVIPPLPPPAAAEGASLAQAAAAGHRQTLEERIGARWLLYLALGSLLLGTSYFVKYAFENEWITPAMRVVLGATAGVALVGAGRRFTGRGLAFFGGMLTGAGIAILYISVYAAFNFYALIGPAVAFGLMAGITALGATLADAQASQALALLAVVGGFLTPFLVSTGRDAQMALFTYDAVLVAGTMFLARRRGWPLLNLASFALAGMTLLAWTVTYYRPSKWVTTEAFFTLFAAMFVYIQRHTWRVNSPLARGVAVVLALSPLAYHVASLAILASHPLGMLVYLIAVTVIAVIAAGQWRSSWLRLSVLVLVGVPMFAWIWRYHSPAWLVPGIVAILAIYVIHLLASLQAAGLSPNRLPAPEILLLHGNGGWLYGALWSLLDRQASEWMGTLAAALAVWNVGIALVQRRHALDAWSHHLALGFALGVAAVAIQFEGAWVTVGWAAEGAALVWIGLAAGREWIRGAGAVLLAVAVLRLADALGDPAAVGAIPLLNPRTASAAFVIGLLALLARLHNAYRDRLAGARVERTTLILVAHLLVLLVITSEIDAAFQVRAWMGTAAGGGAGAATTAELARQVSLSTAWAAYALALVAFGFRRRFAPIRYFAIAVFAFTAGKVFLVDLARLDRIWRILSVIALGLLLLGASYLYQRFAEQADPESAGPKLA